MAKSGKPPNHSRSGGFKGLKFFLYPKKTIRVGLERNRMFKRCGVLASQRQVPGSSWVIFFLVTVSSPDPGAKVGIKIDWSTREVTLFSSPGRHRTWVRNSVSKSTDSYTCQTQRLWPVEQNTACVELSDFFAVRRIVGSLFLPLYISIEMDCLPQEGQTFNLRVADSYQYKVGKKIGHGTYGHVLEATRSDNVKASCTSSFGFVDLEKRVHCVEHIFKTFSWSIVRGGGGGKS